MIKAIYYSEFDNVTGPQIVYQTPVEYVKTYQTINRVQELIDLDCFRVASSLPMSLTVFRIT